MSKEREKCRQLPFPSIDRRRKFTQEICQILFLSIVFDRHAGRVEKDQHDHGPIETLRFDQNPNFTPEIGETSLSSSVDRLVRLT